VPAEGWLGRIHRHQPAQEKQKAEVKETPSAFPLGGNLPVRTNDLRAYLNQRLAAQSESPDDPALKRKPPKAKSESDKVGPVLKSLDAVINHVIAAGRGGALCLFRVSPTRSTPPARRSPSPARWSTRASRWF
jgi:hypothetical protein